MRRTIIPAIMLLAATGLLVATHGHCETCAPPAPSVNVDFLDKRIEEIRFNDTPLDKAIDQLQQLTHINMVVDWTTIEQAGTHRDASITLRLFDLSFHKALELMLVDAKQSTGDDGTLGFQVDGNGIVHISTRHALEANTVTRLYDVHDFLETGFNPPTRSEEPALSRQERSDVLVRILTETVDQASWKEAGGESGTIKEVLGQFLIVQTLENQRKIELVLYNLRRVKAGHERGQPATQGVDLLSAPTTAPMK